MKTDYFYDFAKFKLRPIFKSITGSGIRKTLHLIKKEFPKLKIKNLNLKKSI